MVIKIKKMFIDEIVRKAGRKRRKEGRQGGKKEGRKDGRKEGRKKGGRNISMREKPQLAASHT